MKALGSIFEVTNVERFILTYLANPNDPDNTTFRPITSARVHIGSVLQYPGFFPSFSVKTETDSNGRFTLDCSSLPTGYPAYLIVYRQLQVVSFLGMTIPIYGPIYRSQSFQLSGIDNKRRAIYVFQTELPNEQGVSQAQITTQVNLAKQDLANADSISAFIADNGINVVGKGRGATITFRITLSPLTTYDLNLFVKHKIENFDVDLPGWDWIKGLCVSEDDIEKEVSKGVRAIVSSFNRQIEQSTINAIVQSTNTSELLVKSLFDTSLSLTFSKVRYPVVETRGFGPMTINLRAIVPDPCLGLPRKLY